MAALPLIIQQTIKYRTRKRNQGQQQESSHSAAEGPSKRLVAHFHFSAVPYRARYAGRPPGWATSSGDSRLNRQPSLVAIKNHFWATDHLGCMKWLRNLEVQTTCYRKLLQLRLTPRQMSQRTRCRCRSNRCCRLKTDMAWRPGKEKLTDQRSAPLSPVTPITPSNSCKIIAVECLSYPWQVVLVGSQNRIKRPRSGHSSNTTNHHHQQIGSPVGTRVKTRQPSSMIQWKPHCRQQGASATGWSKIIIS